MTGLEKPHSPIAIEDPHARACHAPGGEEIVGEGRQDLNERHKWWLIEQYMKGAAG